MATTSVPHPLTRARFPELDAGYESWFIRAADPAGGRAVWLRYTVHQGPGHGPVGSLWLTFFDRSADGPVALKESHPDAPPVAREGASYVRIGDSVIGLGRADGRITAPPGAARWTLRFDTGEPPALGLPAEAMYGWPVPRAKPVSIHPATTLHGELEVGGQRIDLEGWRGCVGHNWGPEHTPEWVWMQAIGFDEDAGAWLDCAFGRVRLGPVLTPWLGSGWLHLDGTRHKLGDARGLIATRVDPHAGGCTFRLAGSGLTVTGTVDAPTPASIAWRYSDPADTERLVVHCSIAGLQLRVTGAGGAPRVLTLVDGAGYEHGSRRPTAGVVVAPFTDP
ncbi:MAG: hypothetical protein JWO02_2747 [Solirubrobacterales bacterium]|nr:hypothetical protein [Solirubrobacterales bacterium]